MIVCCKAVPGNWPMACSQELSKNLLHPRTKRTIGDGLLQEDINNMQRSSIDSSCHATLKFHLTEQSSFSQCFNSLTSQLQRNLNWYSASYLQLSNLVDYYWTRGTWSMIRFTGGPQAVSNFSNLRSRSSIETWICWSTSNWEVTRSQAITKPSQDLDRFEFQIFPWNNLDPCFKVGKASLSGEDSLDFPLARHVSMRDFSIGTTACEGSLKHKPWWGERP